MKNVNHIEKQFKEHIKDMNPLEFGLYQRYFITGLYESFIEKDWEKTEKYKVMLEETAKYYSENHDHVYVDEMKRRLDTANKCLIETLEKNQNSIELYIEEAYRRDNDLTFLCTEILKALLEYAKTNEETYSKKLIENMLEITEDRIQFVKHFIELHDNRPEMSKDKDYPLYWLIRRYDEYNEIKEQIKQL